MKGIYYWTYRVMRGVLRGYKEVLRVLGTKVIRY